MKTYRISSIASAFTLACIITLCACNDDYLEKYPESSVTVKTFFQSPQDLQTYTNGLYDMIPYGYDDNNSDNIVYDSNGTDLENMIRGAVNADNNTKGWGSSAWSSLRAVNFMLDHVNQAIGDQSEIDHYIGLARFFRALFYWSKVKTFGDVPWYEHALQTNDEAELYKPRDSRATVMDNVLADLEFAINNMKVKTDKTVVGKYQVEAMAARIALYEGTFRKYQTDLSLPEADKYLQKAAAWAKDVIDNGGFTLVAMSGFTTMFSENKLGTNSEIIMYRKFDEGMSVGNNTHTVCDVYWGVSQSLVNEFLMADGSRFTDLPDYQTKQYTEIFTGRDPRLAASIMAPGTYKIDEANPHIARIEFSGYPQLKFYPARKDLAKGWNLNYNDLSIIRLAEVYLIYAEAKAELGSLTQVDLDISVNKLRTRAGSLPALNMATANANVDPYMAEQYFNVAGANKGVILEIRRERRVEMAFEGLRKDDLFRWKLGTNMIKKLQQGIYIPALGPLDVTGDGVPDIAVLASPQDSDKETYPGLILYYLKDKSGTENTWYLENETSGHIQITAFRDADRKFTEPKYYFYPIPTSEMVLNSSLKQLYGW